MKDEILGAITGDGDRRSLRFERIYDTGREDLWSAITEPGRLARWFAQVRGDLHEGGGYEVVFDEDDASQRAWGTIVECEPPGHLVVSWIFGDGEMSTLLVDLVEDGRRTRLELVHRALPSGATAGYGAGWHAYLDQLDAHLGARDPGGWDSRFQDLLPHYKARLP
jgi:uncharacterized protein YndB with AHSA1/START domain